MFEKLYRQAERRRGEAGVDDGGGSRGDVASADEDYVGDYDEDEQQERGKEDDNYSAGGGGGGGDGNANDVDIAENDAADQAQQWFQEHDADGDGFLSREE